MNSPAFFFINETITVTRTRISAAQHAADGVPVRKKLTMIETADSDTSTADNVHVFPGAGSEQPQRSRRRKKDRTGAGRQAKFRSKNKRDRYERSSADMAPAQ